MMDFRAARELVHEDIEPRLARRISRHVYCHHCQKIGEQILLGRDEAGDTIFMCFDTNCANIITIKWIPSGP